MASYGAVGQDMHTVYVQTGGVDSRRQRTRIASVLFAMATVAAVAVLTTQGPAKSSGLVELLGADGVREFAQATGMTHHAAMTMLASTQMLEQTYGVIGGDLDPTANMAKADKYMIGEHEAAKLMVHIKGGDVTADNAETLFTDQGNDGTTTGSGSLCGKRDLINEKLMQLLNRLRAEVLPANKTITALADAYIAAEELYLVTESNYRDGQIARKAACRGMPNAVTNDATAKDTAADAAVVEKNVYASSAEEIAAIKSEKAMIIMLLEMIGTLHDMNKETGVNIGSDSVGKDENGISNIYKTQVETKSTPQQLAEKFTEMKRLSLRINSPALAAKLQGMAPTTMLAAYKESSEVTKILKSLLMDLKDRLDALEGEQGDATHYTDDADGESTTATMNLVNEGEACDAAVEAVLTNDDARGPAKGDAQNAKDAYISGKVHPHS
mmetsp:Transcript_54159/g.123724  ORF Transcript_54159/g.123724 Transcript_54159/m.123724 type:complete len:441 (+) Transcript_54159:38-1360(+)